MTDDAQPSPVFLERFFGTDLGEVEELLRANSSRRVALQEGGSGST